MGAGMCVKLARVDWCQGYGIPHTTVTDDASHVCIRNAKIQKGMLYMVWVLLMAPLGRFFSLNLRPGTKVCTRRKTKDVLRAYNFA